VKVALAENEFVTSRVQSRIDQKFDFKENAPVLIGWKA
jgi:hypothetical protein